MKKLLANLLFLLLILSSTLSKAAAYWMEIEGTGKLNRAFTIRVIYGRIDDFGIRHRDTGKELELAGEFKVKVLDASGLQTNINLVKKSDCWEGTYTPTKQGIYRILGINDTHPVVDRSATGGKNVRPIDYLCAAYLAGSNNAEASPAQLLDIVAFSNKGIITVKAYNNQAPAKAKTTLRVFNPENWEKELTLDDGEAVFKTTIPGLYIIRQDWEDTTPGEYKGVAYKSVRHRCNYSLIVKP
ncbi:hypothetical protein [Mucilaginibacter pedocola]|uniref:DUF4198 domain-containing protein n=1 Tax=Mucilaginibacter pedocola TaxID=1792845 RepID=A0A1S9PKW4_9SPHI|nr:hypothetical protein [Mucilaginibacter pedocola]OOQ61606.1 hypothetical protein BC343_00585 [Mucilaginibacter pedocola]